MFTNSTALRKIYRWISPAIDIKKIITAPGGYIRYACDWKQYNKLAVKDCLHFSDALPMLHDRTSHTDFDHHYIYLNAWAFREIVGSRPERHVDIGSQVTFVSILSGVLPVTFIDIRPLKLRVSGLDSRSGSILSLPYKNGELKSVSSLHVIEHIGLGRYGDPIDPHGTRKAVSELARVVAPGGNLYIGLPVGRERVCFNAHKIHYPEKIAGWFLEEGLSLKSFSVVNDEGDFIPDANMKEYNELQYGCGMFRFEK